MDPVPRSKLPTFGNEDGDQVIDSVGNIYEYDANTRSWLYRGAAPAPPLVTEETDGLIGPDVFRKISLLQQLINNGVDFSNFKLATEAGNPYYYYFNSSDDLIRFTPEKLTNPKETRLSSTITEIGFQNEDTFVRVANANFSSKTLVDLFLETDLGNYRIIDNSRDVVVIDGDPDLRVGDRVRIIKPEQVQTRLRIEVDRGRLYQKLVRRCCVGPKGRQGEKGFSGPDGAPANDEVFQLPIDTTSGSFVWSTTVATPIDTPISLRIFRASGDSDPIIEVLYSITGTETTTIVILDETVQIEETGLEIDYEPTSGTFSGSIAIVQGGDDLSDWVYKARQQGPQGPKGQAGNAFLQIVTQLLDDPTVRSTEAVITARKAVASNDIITLRAPLFDTVPASNLAAFDGDSIADIQTDRFMAAKVTIREARDIEQYQFTPADIAAPNLDLPLWTPTRDCVQSRRWGQYRFNWFDLVEPKYLFQILPTPKPPEQCCQEDFFFCPNLGDACPPEGEILPPTPIPVPCECECPNPLSGAFFGGSLILDPIILTDPESYIDPDDPNLGMSEDLSEVVVEDPNAIIPLSEVKASGISVIESVLDGTIQTFEQEITFLGNADIRVVLEYDADICGGISEERSSKAFVDSDAIASMISLTDPSGQAIISNDGLWETNTIPVTVAFTVTGPIMQTPDVVPETSPGEVAVPVDEISNPELIPEEFSETTTCAEPVTVTLSVQVNTGEANYCRGFRLTIIARSNRIEPKIPRTFIIGDPETVLPPPLATTEPVIEIPDPDPTSGIPGSDPTEPPPFLPPPSPAPTASIISGGTAVDAPTSFIQLAGGGNFIISYPINGGTFAIVAENNALFNFDFGNVLGQLISAPAPSQVPVHQDLLNFNSSIAVNGLALNPQDAGFDADGLFGPGTYILGGDFISTFSSLIPATGVRTDQWTNTIAFINQPQTADEPEYLVVIARIDASTLISPANSVFANELFESGLTEGVITITLSNPSQSIIESFESGEIVNFDSGNVTLSYYGDQLGGYYPQILISPTPPGSTPGSEPASGSSSPPPVSCVGTISNVVVSPASTEVDESTTYAVDFDFDFEVPVEANFILDFGAGIDISGVTAGSISSPDLDGSFSVSIASQQLVISRVGGTNMPTINATINIAGIINPSAAGSYSVDLTIEDGDTAEVCDGPVGDNISITFTLVSALSSISAVPDIVSAGATADYAIPMTTNGFIPNDAILVYTFPVGADITSAGFSSAQLDGTFTVNDIGQDLIVTRNGDGTATSAGSVTGIIDSVVNPGAGSYSVDVEVQDSGMTTLAGPTSSSSFNITAVALVSTLTNISNVPVDDTESASTDYVVTFDTDGLIPNDGIIIVDFESFGFGLGGVVSVASGDIDGTFSIGTVLTEVVITRNGDGTATPAGTISLTISAVTNPVSFSYQTNVEIQDSGMVTLAGPTDASLITIEPNFSGIANFDVTLDDNTQYAAGVEATFTFDTTGVLPVDGKIRLEFPGGWTTAPLDTVTSGTIDGTFTIDNQGTEITIERNGDGTATAAGSLDLVLSPFTNGGSGLVTWDLYTTDVSDAVIDSGRSSDTSIASGDPAPTLYFTPSDVVENAAGVFYSFYVETVGVMPNDGYVVLSFDGGGAGSAYNGLLGGASVTSGTLDGGFTAPIVTFGTIMSARDGLGTPTGSGVQEIVFGPFTNPVAGTYSIDLELRDSGFGLLESFTGKMVITSDPGAGALQYYWMQPTSESIALFGGAYTFAFSTTGFMPIDAVIDIDFPAGQDITGINSGLPGSVSISGLSGTVTTTVVGQTVRITRNGDGAPSSDDLVVTTTGMLPPPTAGLRTYTVNVRNAALALLESSDFDVNWSNSASTAGYNGVQLDGTAPGGSFYYVDQFVFNAPGLGCGGIPIPSNTFLTARNGLTVCENSGNIPINPFDDPFPINCHYGRQGTIGGTVLVSSLIETRLNRFLAQPCPWQPGQIQAGHVVPESLVGGAASTFMTWRFTIETFITNGIFVLVAPAGFSIAGPAASSTTIPSSSLFIAQNVLGGRTEFEVAPTGTITIEPGTYEITLTGAFNNPASGLQPFGVETRTSSGEVIDTEGLTYVNFS